MEALHYKPRHNRNSILMDATLTRANGGTQDVIVEDLSIDGCCVRGYFLVGDRVSLKLPRIGTFAAKVRWAVLGRAGLMFERRPAP